MDTQHHGDDPFEMWRGPVNRIDPPHCRCTDCLTGRSLPLNMRDQAVLEDLWDGCYINATGYIVTRTVTYAVEIAPSA
jgi:hypothetical protein